MEAWLLWLLVAHPLLLVAGLFSLDGFGLPVVPELLTLLVFAPDPDLSWGLQILAIIVLVETAAAGLLYLLVRRLGLPPRLQRFMAAYAGMLLGQDERLLLLNRFVPVLPAAGAFIHAANWRPWRALGFVALGSVLKYGVLLAASALAFHWLSATEATWVSLGAAVSFVAASALIAVRRRKAQAATGPVAASA
jgi:hypothetical protein